MASLCQQPVTRVQRIARAGDSKTRRSGYHLATGFSSALLAMTLGLTAQAVSAQNVAAAIGRRSDCHRSGRQRQQAR